MVTLIVVGVLVLIALGLMVSSFVVVSQGTIGVVESFGKYRRIMSPGLNIRIPIIESIRQKISTQNETVELKFQAITQDQANVNFKAMLLYRVMASDEETIKRAVYSFSSGFSTALARTIEGSIRGYVATKKQSEILGVRQEIVNHVKNEVDAALQQWGYHLVDLQINDIAFDEEVMKSMSRVVAAINLKTAAENEGEAEKIRKTKSAEADAGADVIRAEGIAKVREIAGNSLKEASPQLLAILNLDKYCDTMEKVAKNGEGKIIFFDSSAGGMNSLMANIGAMIPTN